DRALRVHVRNAPRVTPDWTAGAGIERRGIIERPGDEHYAIHYQRSIFDIGSRELKRPLAAQRTDVGGRDGFQAAVMRALQIAPVSQPVLRLFTGIAQALERNI